MTPQADDIDKAKSGYSSLQRGNLVLSVLPHGKGLSCFGTALCLLFIKRQENQLILHDEARMALTKEQLEDLRKGKNRPFEQLFKRLAEHSVNISHTNLKNYEINDSVHSRTAAPVA